METLPYVPQPKIPWNKGKIVGQKPAFKLKEVWAIRIRLQMEKKVKELALFNMAIDSKLRGCDLVKLRISDVMHGTQILKRAIIIQQKTKKPVQFEITEQTRNSIRDMLDETNPDGQGYLFRSSFKQSEHLSTRQYALIVKKWVSSIGLEPMEYGTHSLRRTKPSLIYRKTKNLRVVQLLLGHTKLESTIRYLGIEVDDALEVSEQIEV